MSDSNEGFQTKYNSPLPSLRVENLARILCVQSKVFIRTIEDWDKVPLDAQHQFREYACELAEILGMDGFENTDHEKLVLAARRFNSKCDGTAEDGRVAYSNESYSQFKEALGDG